MKRAGAAIAAIALCLTLTACDDHETDENPCGDTGKPVADGGGFGSGTPGVIVREAFITPLKGGSGGGGGGKGGGSTSAGGAKAGSSGSGAKPASGTTTTGRSASTGTSAFPGAKATGSRTFTAPNGTRYAMAPRTTIPRYAPPMPYAAGASPVYVYAPSYHPSPYLWWALYGNYPGATTIIECR